MIRFEQIAFNLTFGFYTLAMFLYLWHGVSRRINAGKYASFAAAAGLLANTVALGIRAVDAGRMPLANGYEFLLVFVWAIVLLYLIFEYRTKLKLVGLFVFPVAWALIGYVAVEMPEHEKTITPLMPALKSNWLTVHVITAAGAYGAFALACGMAVIYLWGRGLLQKHQLTDEFLDDLTYSTISFGFLLLTLAIVSGAIWAEQAWGNYWSWDPKETWSLVIWLIYGGYLHARIIRDLRGRPAAIIVVAGFIATLFTFFGVNYLLPGLHSYA